MKIEVRYLSKSGNTKKVADAIGNAVSVPAMMINETVPADTDLLFLGGAVYAFGIDDEMKKFIAGLPQSVKKVAVFSTSAIVKSAYDNISKLLSERKIAVYDEGFYTRGEFKFMHKGRPNADDLKLAVEFAKRIAAQ
jgi:flavodoxin